MTNNIHRQLSQHSLHTNLQNWQELVPLSMDTAKYICDHACYATEYLFDQAMLLHEHHSEQISAL